MAQKQTEKYPGLVQELTLQLQVLQEFCALLTSETGALADMKLNDMAAINGEKERLFAAIEARTGQLRQALAAHATGAGLPGTATLGEIAEGLQSETVRRLHREINRVARRITELADMNREIAERFAETAGSSLQILTQLINQSNTYGSSGGYQQKSSGPVMLNREA